MAYADLKDLSKRTAVDKVLHDEAPDITENRKYDEYLRGIASLVYNFFEKKLLVAVLKMKRFLIKNQLKNYTNQLLKNSIKKSTLTFY